MQCYTILYSKEGYFLIFKKRAESYFFHGSNENSGTIFPPNGTPIIHGPGMFTFPGGALNLGEDEFKGCLREFREECGSAISFGYQLANKPQSLLYLDNLILDGSKHPILYNQHQIVGNDYTVLYLEFSIDNLKQIQDIILTTNFEAANQVRKDIQDRKISDYDSIFQRYPFCPLDDELGQVQIWQVTREKNQIRDLKKDKGVTDWYYDMIVFLANEILQFNVEY
jgi:8-oxo-dGTP pyrophosphatase MutT (NUDIX family)